MFKKKRNLDNEPWLPVYAGRSDLFGLEELPNPEPGTSVIDELANAKEKISFLERQLALAAIDQGILESVQRDILDAISRLDEFDDVRSAMAYVGDRMAKKLDKPGFNKEWDAAKDGVKLRDNNGKYRKVDK